MVFAALALGQWFLPILGWANGFGLFWAGARLSAYPEVEQRFC